LPGKKTAARIAKLKAILKARGGAQTFKKLQEDLDYESLGVYLSCGLLG